MMKIKDVSVKMDASLKNYNTYRIESKCKYLVEVNNVEGLINLIKYLEEENIKYLIIGNGSNVLFDEYYDGAIIKLNGLQKIEVMGDKIIGEAGVMMGALVQASIDNNLTGLEWAISIPGTLGGSVFGNAGAYNSCIFDTLVEIKALKDGKVISLKKDEIKYAYRFTNLREMNLIVLEATFKLDKGLKEESLEIIQDRIKRRWATQPLDKPSCGSVFRNPQDDYAARLIEVAGLKGKTIGGAQISEKHANFIINMGGATAQDIKDLISLIKQEIKDKFGIDLILELEIMNWR